MVDKQEEYELEAIMGYKGKRSLAPLLGNVKRLFHHRGKLEAEITSPRCSSDLRGSLAPCCHRGQGTTIYQRKEVYRVIVFLRNYHRPIVVLLGWV